MSEIWIYQRESESDGSSERFFEAYLAPSAAPASSPRP